MLSCDTTRDPQQQTRRKETQRVEKETHGTTPIKTVGSDPGGEQCVSVNTGRARTPDQRPSYESNRREKVLLAVSVTRQKLPNLERVRLARLVPRRGRDKLEHKKL